jgi:hypothetical protein
LVDGIYVPSTQRQQLLVAGTVGRIVSGLDLREPLHADGVDLRDPVFKGSAPNLVFDLAIPQGTFECDELSFLESPGELAEIAPGIDPMPFGAGFVVAFVVLSLVATLRTTYSRLF